MTPIAARGLRPRSDRRRLLLIGSGIAALYVAGGGLLALYGPSHLTLVGAAPLAFTLGLRHGFDADHIAAIDNTTRQLRHRGGRPLGVGFFFSLGHSSVVLALTLIAAAVSNAIPGVSGVAAVGAAISGAFLWLVGILNLGVLFETVGTARGLRATDHAGGHRAHAPRGLLMRLGLERPLRLVSRSPHMFMVGLLFGLGFETASEVALIALGAGAGASGLPLLGVLSLPLLFAAGMSTVDTVDGVLMLHAYDWALRRPARKLFYNLTITGLSIVVALTVGTVQLLHAAISAFGLRGGLWSWLSGLDFQVLGYALAGLLIGTWVVALIVWRALGLEREAAPAGTG